MDRIEEVLVVQEGEGGPGGTQSIERAIELLLSVGREGTGGARLSDLVAKAGLPKPTVRRVLLALVRYGLLEQDAETRRYFLGPEAYEIGTLASARFDIQALAVDALSRLSQCTGDTAFLSVRRDAFAVCLHREEGPYPIRTHVLQKGDRHPLGVGAGSLALLAALPDDEIDRAIGANEGLLASRYENHTPDRLRELVQLTRERGYAMNPGMLMRGSWGIGVAVRGRDGLPVGALSIAAVEARLDDARQAELAPLLQAEAQRVESRLLDPHPVPRASADDPAVPRPARPIPARPRAGTPAPSLRTASKR